MIMGPAVTRGTTRRLAPLLVLMLAAGLSACGPVPVDQAERSCLRNAELAQRPRGEIVLGVGAGGGGPRAIGRVDVEVSGDYLMGRDPNEVFNRCVLNRSGQLPVTPLASQPGWRG